MRKLEWCVVIVSACACVDKTEFSDKQITVALNGTSSVYGAPIGEEPFVLVGTASDELDRGQGSCVAAEGEATVGFSYTAAEEEGTYVLRSTELSLSAGVWSCTIDASVAREGLEISRNSRLTLEVVVYEPACELAANIPESQPLAIGQRHDLQPRCRCTGKLDEVSVSLDDTAFTLADFSAVGGATWDDAAQLLDVATDIPIELSGDCVFGVGGSRRLPVTRKVDASWDLSIECWWPAGLDKTVDPIYVDTSANPEASVPITWTMDTVAARDDFDDQDHAGRYDLFEAMCALPPGETVVLTVDAANDEGFRDSCVSSSFVVRTPTPGVAAVPRGSDVDVWASPGIPSGPFTLRMVVVPGRSAGRWISVGDDEQYVVVAVDANNRVLVDVGGVIPGTGGQLDTIPTLITETWGPELPVEIKLVRTDDQLVLYRDGCEVDREAALDLPDIEDFDMQLMGAPDMQWESLVIAPRANAGARNVLVDVRAADPSLSGGLRCSFESLGDSVGVGEGYACEEGRLAVWGGSMWPVQ